MDSTWGLAIPRARAVTPHQGRDDASSSFERTPAMRIAHVVQEENVARAPLKDKTRLVVCCADACKPSGRNLLPVSKVSLPREAVGPEQFHHRSRHVRSDAG